MSRQGWNDPAYDLSLSIDKELYREHSRLTVGNSAFHQLEPSEMVMEIEEFEPRHRLDSDRTSLRVEIFSGFMEYLFAEGPEPQLVRSRIEGLFNSFAPDLAKTISGPREWIGHEEVIKVLQKKEYSQRIKENADAARSRGALSTWCRELSAEVDQDFVQKIILGLISFLTCELLKWKNCTAVAFCVAKALRPQLVANMSLHDIAILCGDSGRATPCARIKRLYNDRVAKAGNKACYIHFQKSETAVEKYASAQIGNKNRTKGMKPNRYLLKASSREHSDF